MDQEFRFQIQGKALVLIDWANLYAQQKKLGWKISVENLYCYFQKEYPSIIDKVMIFHGKDPRNPKSQQFLEKCEKIGYSVVSKEVKYLRARNSEERRKCDFDCEISIEMLENINNYDTFLLFSGDGDFKYITEKMLDREKWVFIISRKQSIGRELWDMKNTRKTYPRIIEIDHLKEFLSSK